MKVVINSSPLIALSGINKLDLLSSLYSKIIIPQNVYQETVLDGEDQLIQNFIENHSQVTILSAKNIVLLEFIEDYLDKGEAEVITIAKELNIDFVIIDELKGRKIASKHGLNVIGSLGILLIAKKMGLIQTINEYIIQMEKSGIWISTELKSAVLKNANE